MKSGPRLHPQRIALAAIAALAAAACFVPVAKIPQIGAESWFVLGRKGALALFALVFAVALIGRWASAISSRLRWIGSVACALIVSFCVFRFAAYARRSLPTFADDDPAAGPYYERACQRGVMEGCTRLGACYWDGSCGLGKDVHHAFSLFEQACDGGDFSACHQMATCLEVGGCGLSRSSIRAVALYEKGCGGGEASSCNNLGVCYLKGECGLSKDDTRAGELFKKACAGGDGSACHNLGLLRD
jgi:TPR repeat protein